ncbi:MAG: MFS transporter [Xenococcaceae cyanobacterium]
MRIFFLVWIGQVISLFGSKLTEFALGFWILEQTYKETGTITQFALTVLFIYLPKVIVSPLAGVLIDRWNRRYAMILSDLMSGIVTVTLLLVVWSGQLEIWHIYLAIIVTSIFNAFQLPAYTAAIAQLVPKQNLSQANGMVQASSAIAKIAAPVSAGLLLQVVHLKGILLIDFMTFLVALISLSLVKFPELKRRKRKQTKIFHQLFSETQSSWHYVAVRLGLRNLLIFIAVSYFTTGMLEVVLWPLLYESNSTEEMGIVLSIGGCGMLLGSIAISLWKGSQDRVKTILCFVAFQGVIACLAGMRISLAVLAAGIFAYLFSLPIIVSCNQAIWQSKVPPRLQGRIFALQQTTERSLSIAAYLLAGPLVDRVFNPLMAENGLLANSIGKFIGVGFGQGIALLLIVLGIFNLVAVAIACREPRLRNLEKELPDRTPPNTLLV